MWEDPNPVRPVCGHALQHPGSMHKDKGYLQSEERPRGKPACQHLNFELLDPRTAGDKHVLSHTVCGFLLWMS